MKRFSGQMKRLLVLALVLVLAVGAAVPAQAAVLAKEEPVEIKLEGRGTKSDPFLIQSYTDLCLFRDYVNDGVTFEGLYVRQSANIDMRNRHWVPIGIDGAAFYGVYDGGGHYVENLNVPVRKDVLNCNGFFGTLGGTVVNFGIESGTIKGDYCGSIASESVGERAAILNCYSKATVYGIRAGGIVDSFSGNVVACSWFDGNTLGDTCAFISNSGDIKVYHTYTTDDHAMATYDINTPTSGRLTKEQLYSDWFMGKLNLSVGLTQYLFAANYGVDVMQWELDEDGNVTFSGDTQYLDFFGFLNLYLLPLALVLIALAYAIAFVRAGKGNVWSKYHRDINAIAVVSAIVAVFVDTAMINKGPEYLNLGNGLFLILINLMCLAFGTVAVRHCRVRFRRDWIPITVAIVAVAVLELFQFDLVPKYDASIYYGSLVKAVDLFRVDFLTYIGAFVCWKWAHGLVLLIAPLEFLLPGQMVGVYVANMVINAVTMGCLYWLLRQISPKITPLLAALGSLILILCPYQLGLFTYLSMDPHAALFAVWLLCAYVKKNPILVSFCGYLLAFNKISGLVFYVFFLLTMGVFEALAAQGKNLVRKILNWWKWKTVLLWIFPAVAFLMTMVIGEDLTIQNFYGSYTGAAYGLKNLHELMNTFVQSFVYGLRWVFVLLLLAMALVLLLRRRKLSDVLTRDGIRLLVGSLMGCVGVVLILCLYQGDADCPRYTELMNIFFALSFPIAVQVLAKNKTVRHLLAGTMALLLLVQTYWTIDPSMILTSDTIDTGKKTMYKLAPPGDSRWGMNIGKDYGPGYEVVGDLYTYNLEHSYYDSLLDDVLTHIQPDEDTQLIQLDVMWYETHIYGNKYRIYWNTRTNNRTYDGKDPDSIFLANQQDAFTEDICEGDVSFDDTFYLLVPARVDPSDAMQAIEDQGYELFDEIHAENFYGALSAYGYRLE